MITRGTNFWWCLPPSAQSYVLWTFSAMGYAFQLHTSIPCIPKLSLKWPCGLDVANQKWGIDFENQNWPRKSILCVVLVSKCLSDIVTLWDKLWFGEIGKYLQPQITNLGMGRAPYISQSKACLCSHSPQAFWLNVNQSLGFLLDMLTWSSQHSCRLLNRLQWSDPTYLMNHRMSTRHTHCPTFGRL